MANRTVLYVTKAVLLQHLVLHAYTDTKPSEKANVFGYIQYIPWLYQDIYLCGHYLDYQAVLSYCTVKFNETWLSQGTWCAMTEWKEGDLLSSTLCHSTPLWRSHSQTKGLHHHAAVVLTCGRNSRHNSVPALWVQPKQSKGPSHTRIQLTAGNWHCKTEARA